MGCADAEGGAAALDGANDPRTPGRLSTLERGLAALTVLFGMRFFALSTRSFLLFNVLLGALWLLITLVVVRDYGEISQLGDAAGDPGSTDRAARLGPHSGNTEAHQE